MKKKRGRPPKPAGQARAERIEIRSTATEKESYEKAASESGLELSEWIRNRLNSAAKRKSR